MSKFKTMRKQVRKFGFKKRFTKKYKAIKAFINPITSRKFQSVVPIFATFVAGALNGSYQLGNVLGVNNVDLYPDLGANQDFTECLALYQYYKLSGIALQFEREYIPTANVQIALAGGTFGSIYTLPPVSFSIDSQIIGGNSNNWKYLTNSYKCAIQNQDSTPGSKYFKFPYSKVGNNRLDIGSGSAWQLLSDVTGGAGTGLYCNMGSPSTILFTSAGGAVSGNQTLRIGTLKVTYYIKLAKQI